SGEEAGERLSGVDPRRAGGVERGPLGRPETDPDRGAGLRVRRAAPAGASGALAARATSRGARRTAGGMRMERLQRATVLLALIEELRDGGSWGGETHLQKAVYLLQELFQVPLGFDFVLYRHGPYSFDLADEVTALQADQLLATQLRQP